MSCVIDPVLVKPIDEIKYIRNSSRTIELAFDGINMLFTRHPDSEYELFFDENDIVCFYIHDVEFYFSDSFMASLDDFAVNFTEEDFEKIHFIAGKRIYESVKESHRVVRDLVHATYAKPDPSPFLDKTPLMAA